MDASAVCKFSSWNAFKSNWEEKISDIRGPENPLVVTDGHISESNDGVVFRGMGNSNYSLISSFDRFLLNHNIESEDSFALYEDAICRYAISGIEIAALDEAYLARHPDDPNAVVRQKQFDLAEGHAQHYGMPTRLLDWSCSPYIAAFFGATSCVAADWDYFAVWCLDSAEVTRLFRDSLKVITQKNYKNNRLINQKGCFTRNVSNLPNMEELFQEEHNRTFNTPKFPVLIKCLIPTSEAEKALVDLEYMGIDFLSIYPDIEGVRERTKYYVMKQAAI